MNSENPFDDSPASNPADDFFTGGFPPCKFEQIGAMHGGVILSYEMAQQRDINTGEPKTWPDGNPAMMLVVTLQTAERDPNVENDEGQRKLYVNKPGGMFSAIKNALGKQRLTVGGALRVKFTKTGKPTRAGFSPPKEYIAQYVAPGNTAPANGNGGQYPRTNASIAAEVKPGAEVFAATGAVPEEDIPF